MKNYKQQTNHFKNFNALLDAATTQYTLSYRDACKALKCSRKWADEYIRPNVPFIYLSNGKGTGKANYARIVSSEVNWRREEKIAYSNESVYLDREEFYNFITSHIVSCQKRSKAICKAYFVKPEKLENYYKDATDLLLRLTNEKKTTTQKILSEKLDNLYLEYAANNYVKQYIPRSIVLKTKRTSAKFIDVPYPDCQIEEWMAVHDMMDYGDVEETIYRELFEQGYIRIEVKIPDKDGVIKDKGKVFYITDPNPVESIAPTPAIIDKILQPFNSENDRNVMEKLIESVCRLDKINITQKAWFDYNAMLGKNITY